jgi:dienelactone hydrolase
MRTFLLIPAAVFTLLAQQAPTPGAVQAAPAAAPAAAPQPSGNDEVLKKVDDLMWHVILDDIAHVDKVEYNILEYRKRSPVFHAKELQTPLPIHTNTNDEDVNVPEVEHLIEALKAEGKKFEYKIYQDAPGGHYFNRIDTKAARESRREVWRFLAGYLKPDRAIN